MGEFNAVDLRDQSAHSLDVEAAASKAKRQHASPAAANAPLDETLGSRSIFDLYTRKRKTALLLVCAISMLLVPICDTIYLPSLTVVERDLKATPEATAASVSVYMYTVGLGALFLGPLADRIGRRPTLCGATALFTALSVVCVFSPNIQFLLAFRAAQGFIVSACSTTSSAILADVFAPEERGRAMGLAAIPFLVGPVAGPLLGGALAQQLGWRSTFVALAIFGAVSLIAQIFVVQETHHHFAVRRLERTEGPAAAAAIREPIPPPEFAPPTAP